VAIREHAYECPHPILSLNKLIGVLN
jgi:hypothetical protein